ncbi:MAG: LVIVD repeat-containing protein, partial [Longimicrobiales bacterium]
MMRPPILLLTIAIAFGACDTDPVANDDDDDPFTRDPIALPVVGHGMLPVRVTAEVAADGAWAYTTTWGNLIDLGSALEVWDVSGATPLLVDSVIIADATTLGDVQISDDGNLLVIATERENGSIIVFDRSDPAHPVMLSRHLSDNTRNFGVHTVKLGRVNGTLYAFLSVNPGGATGNGQLVVVDLSDPTNPREILAMPLGGPVLHDVFVRDGYLFTAEWDDGMSIWDIGGGGLGGSPADPVRIGNVQTVDGNVHNIWWYHAPDGGKRYVFVGEEAPANVGADSDGDIHVVDISDMTNPREVAFYTLATAGTHNFTMDEANGIL